MIQILMAYSDDKILPVLSQLSVSGKPTTATEISKLTLVPYGTVKRSLDRLEQSGRIRRRGVGRRWGSYYEVIDASRR